MYHAGKTLQNSGHLWDGCGSLFLIKAGLEFVLNFNRLGDHCCCVAEAVKAVWPDSGRHCMARNENQLIHYGKRCNFVADGEDDPLSILAQVKSFFRVAAGAYLT